MADQKFGIGEGFCQAFSPVIVYINHRRCFSGLAFWTQKICKKALFAAKVRLHGFMVIQVVLGQIGKDPSIKFTTVYPMLIQAVGGNFHDDVGDPGLFHVEECLL